MPIPEYSTTDQPEVVNEPKIHYDNREYTSFDGRGLPKTGRVYQEMITKLFKDDIFIDRFEYTTLGEVEIVSYRSLDIKDKLLFLEDGSCYGEVGKNSFSKDGIHIFTQDKIKGAIRGGKHMEDTLLGYSNRLVLIQTGYETFEVLVKGKKGKVGIMKEGTLRTELLNLFKESREESDRRALSEILRYGS